MHDVAVALGQGLGLVPVACLGGVAQDVAVCVAGPRVSMHFFCPEIGKKLRLDGPLVYQA